MNFYWHEATQTMLEVFMTLFILFAALFIGVALVIEAETGKPAKVAVQEWWTGQ